MLRTMYGFVLAFAALAIFVTSRASAQDQERPMKMSGSGVVDGTYAAPNYGGWVVVETGEATHLGLYTRTGEGGWFMDLDTGLGSVWGSGFIEAANGDVIEYDILINMDWVTLIGDFTITFTGGTGRFAYATGSVHDLVQFAWGPVPAQMLFNLEAVGTITY